MHNLKGKQSTSGPFWIGKNWSPNEWPAEIILIGFYKGVWKKKPFKLLENNRKLPNVYRVFWMV